MRYVNLGNTGLRVSRVCLGMMSFGRHESRRWALDEAAAEPIVKRAVDGGVIFFDTADVYNGGQSEIVTGRLLRRLFGSREEYVVATKVHGRAMPGENGRGLSRKHVMASIDASLERLGLDYVDLYQIHRWDDLTPIQETMDALHDVVKAGKARYLGASSMYAWQFAKAQGRCAGRVGPCGVGMAERDRLLAVPAAGLVAAPGGRDRGQRQDHGRDDLNPAGLWAVAASYCGLLVGRRIGRRGRDIVPGVGGCAHPTPPAPADQHPLPAAAAPKRDPPVPWDVEKQPAASPKRDEGAWRRSSA